MLDRCDTCAPGNPGGEMKPCGDRSGNSALRGRPMLFTRAIAELHELMPSRMSVMFFSHARHAASVTGSGMTWYHTIGP